MPPVKRSSLIALAVAGILASAASAQPTRLLMPGVTYERHVEFTLHGPVVVHVVAGPRPTGLYSLEPVMARGVVQGREKLTAVERRLAPQANVVGVNGDLFATSGRPQGLFLQDGVMQTQPIGSRSSLGIGASGALSVDRVPFIGDWRGLGPRRGLSALNDQVGPNGTVLFTPDWGRNTPVASDAVEAVLSSFPAAKPNVDLTATVTQIVNGGNHPVAARRRDPLRAWQRRHPAGRRVRRRRLADRADDPPRAPSRPRSRASAAGLSSSRTASPSSARTNPSRRHG